MIAVKRTGYVAMLLNYRLSLSLSLSLIVPSEREKERENVSDAGCSGKRHPFRVHSV